MANENEEKRVVTEAMFQQLYQKLTSEKIKQASDELFSATSEELAEAFKPDNYSI